ncbi:MAG: hypothetical protein A3J60_00325 [Candidatus Pacebacteria bacterium RIFCSPHIGHO2_02_FULL_46_9]|nr:MAG: hypothetical protein A3J60_00325 [Candidatus Pacebacteria bacterium RIFCSPHIGHO2_02_FULL_46_9]
MSKKLQFLEARDETVFQQMAEKEDEKTVLIAGVNARILYLTMPMGFGSLPDTRIMPFSTKDVRVHAQKLNMTTAFLKEENCMNVQAFLLLRDFFPWLYFVFETMERKERLKWLTHLTKNEEVAKQLKIDLSVGWRSNQSTVEKALDSNHKSIGDNVRSALTGVSLLGLLANGTKPSENLRRTVEQAWENHACVLNLDNDLSLTQQIQLWMYLTTLEVVPKAIGPDRPVVFLELSSADQLFPRMSRMRTNVHTPVITGIK